MFVIFANRHFVEVVEFHSRFAGSDIDINSIFSFFVHLLFERLFENKICRVLVSSNLCELLLEEGILSLLVL